MGEQNGCNFQAGVRMVEYKLYYFGARWLAEPARWMFAQAGQKYTDIRITPEDWPNYKAKMPFGTIPVLEIDGKQLAQSTAIYRYLARELGLDGKDDFDQARCDSICDYVQDFKKDIPNMVFGDEESTKAAAKKFTEEQYAPFMTNFEKLLTENNGGDGFFVGDNVTWADFVFISFLDILVDNFELAKEKSRPLGRGSRSCLPSRPG